MRSASCYTDLRRTVAYAKNRKVQYPGGVAKNWETLQAALPCNPNFDIQNYVGVPIWCSQTNACATLVPITTSTPCSSTGYNQGFEVTRHAAGTNPIFNPALQANPFDTASWPATISTSTQVGGANVVPFGNTSDFFWETRFYVIPPTVPYTFIFKIDADDAVAIKNLTTSTVVANRWSQAAPPGFGGSYVYSDPITITTCPTEFLMVSANATPPNGNYILSVYSINPPAGSPPYTQGQMDAQPVVQIYPYCYLV